MRTLSPSRLLLAGLFATTFLGAAQGAHAQAFIPAGAPHPVILLGAYLDYAGLLLTPPRGYGFTDLTSPSADELRMTAYREFEISLQERTARLANLSGTSSEERKRAKKKMLNDIGERLATLPGGALLVQGGQLWQRFQETTNLDLDGYRVRLQLDDAVGGKLALKVQKRLH